MKFFPSQERKQSQELKGQVSSVGLEQEGGNGAGDLGVLLIDPVIFKQNMLTKRGFQTQESALVMRAFQVQTDEYFYSNGYIFCRYFRIQIARINPTSIPTLGNNSQSFLWGHYAVSLVPVSVQMLLPLLTKGSASVCSLPELPMN